MTRSQPPEITIRAATSTDLTRLPAVERSAATRFSPANNPAADPALAWIADAPVMTPDEFAWFHDGAREGRRLFVAVAADADAIAATESDAPAREVSGEQGNEGTKRLVGFVATKRLDGTVFVSEMSVSAECQSLGVGSRLLERVQNVADDPLENETAHDSRWVGVVSLTTDRFAKWNAPFYARRGFIEVDAALVGHGHVEELKEEVEVKGLDGNRRCCMMRIRRKGGPRWLGQTEVKDYLLQKLENR